MQACSVVKLLVDFLIYCIAVNKYEKWYVIPLDNMECLFTDMKGYAIMFTHSWNKKHNNFSAFSIPGIH